MDGDYVTVERISLQQGVSSILFLNVLELFLLLGAFLLNLLFLCVLLRYSVFHIHLRIICLHITSAITLITVYSLIRSLVSLYQLFGGSVITELDDSSTCLFVQEVPTCFCMLFIAFPLLLVIERAIATEKVRGYEDFHFPSGMMRLCVIFWIPAIVWLIFDSFTFASQSSILSCELRNLREQSWMQRSVWYLVVTFFNLIFSLMLRGLTTKNQRHEVESVTSERSRYTLSHRFQLRENSRTCSFLVSLHSLICISFITMCFVDVAVTDFGPTNDIYALLFRKELCFVVSPLFLIFYALNFLCRLDIVYDKAKKLVRAVYGYEEEKNLLA
ncbi:hypothetical protein RB195_003560 [Necator americanus]|uniref:G-protein coupled receptors family 1 profile domain-containing protein n=1 Tax=Necator americanus TaxID=51031 RepID=A0ABR1DP36_NECAM